MKNIFKMKTEKLKLTKIFPNPLQPRVEFDKEEIIGLAESIKEIGLINPIQVKKVDNEREQYEIVCGERRFRAYKFLKLKEIDVIIKTYKKGNDEMVESLVENLQRSNLSSVEKENYIYKLWELKVFKTKRKLASSLGYKEDYISSLIKIKELRDRLKISKTISSRVIQDLMFLKKDKDVLNVISKLEKNELMKSQVRGYARVIFNSTDDINKSLLNNEISLKQAEKITKIKNPELKKSVIKAHKQLKKINNIIDNKISEKKNKVKGESLVKTNEYIAEFRNNIIELQNKNQSTIKSLIKCIPLVNCMDSKQVERLKYNKELLESNLNNVLDILERLNNKIEE